MELQLNYRISEQECREAFRLWLDQDKYNALTQEERDTVDVLMDADTLGHWPVTVGEVLAHWKQEAEDRERKHIASWQDEGRITAYDLSCHEERLAAGHTDGPFMTFMSVAVDLNKSRKDLTVGDVRAEIRKRNK